MTSTLHDHLARLADEATPVADAPSGRELWERGRRYQRRRRAGTAVIAGVAAVLVLGIGTVSWQRSAAPPVVAPAGAPVGLPSKVYDPSHWLPGTEGHPLGQVVTVFPHQRGGWLGAEPGFVGISATTGEYRFLDLPDRAGDDIALAPDGRHVAYWTTGSTTGSPNTLRGTDPVAGVAVYDTVTGEVSRHPIETEHGLMDGVLVWIDADTLAIDTVHYLGGDGDSDMDQASGHNASALRWDVGGDPVPFPEFDDVFNPSPTPSVGGRVALGTDDGIAIVSDSEVRDIGGRGFVNTQTVAINPSGTLVAGISERGGDMQNVVAVAPVPSRGRWLFSEVTENRQNHRVLGWTDDQHVVVQRRLKRSGNCMCMGLVQVDVRTGTAETLINLPRQSYSSGLWAADLFGQPVVDRPAPPTPMSPRLTTFLLVLTLGGAAFGVWRWRRRVEP